jgi:hypothetical protein
LRLSENKVVELNIVDRPTRFDYEYERAVKTQPFSNERAYVTLANATLYDGLRKAGLP